MKPPYLKKGDLIYLVAPSFGCASWPYDERLDRSISYLKKLGYRVKEGPNVRLNLGVAGSNTPEKRAEEFMEAYESEAKVIFSVGGGETMMEILPHIDFERLKKLPPKWFLGYSDNTNLVYPLTAKLDLQTVYSECAGCFFLDPIATESQLILYLLTGAKKEFEGFDMYQSMDADTHDLGPFVLNRKKVITDINYTKPFKGRLLGGCLDCLLGTLGTRFDNTKEYVKRHQKEGVILFIESCEFNSIGYRRALFQLRQAGWFDNLSGILIGRPMRLEEESFDVSFDQVAKDMLGDLNIPILLNCDFGHLKPTIPLVSGALTEVTFSDNDFKLKYLED